METNNINQLRTQINELETEHKQLNEQCHSKYSEITKLQHQLSVIKQKERSEANYQQFLTYINKPFKLSQYIDSYFLITNITKLNSQYLSDIRYIEVYPNQKVQLCKETLNPYSIDDIRIAVTHPMRNYQIEDIDIETFKSITKETSEFINNQIL